MNSNSQTSLNTLTNAVEEKLRDIKPPVEIPDYLFWLWIFLGLLAVASIVFFLWKFWLKKKFAPVPLPPIPPHVRARNRLKDALRFIAEPKPFTVAISDAIRFFLEEHFELRAPERTTEEFLYELQTSTLLNDPQKRSLGEFLSGCDLIKFAQYDPTQMELEDLHTSAMRIIDETEPKPNPPALDSRLSSLDTK